MTEPTELSVKKVQEQFDQIPYPNIAIEVSPHNNIDQNFKFSLTTAHYRRSQKMISPQGKIILDLGCGTGWLTLNLAVANPEARIIGIDISAESIKWAENRFKHHDFAGEFHAMPFEEISSLDIRFDFIHCSDVLYLLPDPLEALKVMRSLLTADGIIHANLHSSYQRYYFYQGQHLCKYLGLMDETATEMEFSIVREMMNALDERVLLKVRTWNADPNNSFLAANYLLQEDKGYTIPEMFTLIHDADLEFISMTNWNQWDVRDLYKDKKTPSEYLDTILEMASVEEKLHIYEIFQPVNRLLDFWCCPTGKAEVRVPPIDWEDRDWETAMVYLHPELRHPKIKESLEQAIALYAPFNIHVFIQCNAASPITLYTAACACLYLLWDQPLSLKELGKAWHQIKPCNWITKAVISEREALEEIKQTAIEMEFLMLILVQRVED